MAEEGRITMYKSQALTTVEINVLYIVYLYMYTVYVIAIIHKIQPPPSCTLTMV